MERVVSFINNRLFLVGLAVVGYLIGHHTSDPTLGFMFLGPVLGSGIMPAAGVVASELTAVTRRAFVPKLVVQTYQSTPLLAMLLANNQSASGGASSVTVPVQGTNMVTTQQSDYSGSFAQPSVQPGIQNAEFNLKLSITPIPFLGMEAAVQIDYAVIPIIEARMNDAGNNLAAFWSNALYNNTSNNLQLIGLPGAVDDSTNLVNYGNINRSTNTFWKAKVYNAGSVNPTRQNVLQYLTGCAKSAGGEMPNFAVCGFGTWALLAQDYIGQETYMVTPGASFDKLEDGPRSGFRALMVAGVPVFADMNCPEGTMYILNSNYLSMYIHDHGSFAFTGFESTLSNWQLGYVGAIVNIAELVLTKPSSCARVGSYNYISL